MVPAYDRLEFETDGHLTVTSMMILSGLERRGFGDAVGFLLARAGALPPDAQAVACEGIERAVEDARGEGREVEFDAAALVGVWRTALDDPFMTDVARLAVRLLLRLEPEAIFAPLPTDAEGRALRERLASDLRNASAKAVGPPSGDGGTATDDENVRGIDFAEANGGDHVTRRARPESEPDDAEGIDLASPPPPPSAGPAPATAQRPTYRAYGMLDCDDTVSVGETFTVEVGLSPRPSPGVAGGSLEINPPVPMEPYQLDIQLFADGFDLAAGQHWRHSLEVSFDQLYPSVAVELTARDMPDEMADREISATFAIGGEQLGFFKRDVHVTRTPMTARLARAVAPAGGVDIPAPSGDPKADLTITIKKGLESGKLLWSIESPVAGIALEGHEPPSTDIGDEPEKFAVGLIRTLFAHGSAPGLLEILRGRGKRIRDAMPDGVMRAIEAVAAATSPAPPQILLLTDEPYVPWELTLLDDPWFADAPPFLAAQADVGRWILRSRTIADPPRSVDGSQMAVVWGVYEGPSIPRLVSAEEEAQQLEETYHAASVTAEGLPVRDLLNGTPPADILHFAVHGKFDPQAATEGIQLVKGPPVVPDQIGGSNLTGRAPFVFLNACQIGSAQTVLGGYGGVAHAFLEAGASAVVAPLWSIDDKIAKGIALTFYEQALAQTPDASAPTVAGLLRKARHGLFDTAEAPSATYLAYQFYGHPSLRLTWEGGSNG